MPKVTFYGHFSGWSSYPTVCKAIATWLHSQGVDLELCDLRPEQLFDGVEAIPKVSIELHRAVYLRAQEQRYVMNPSVPSAPGVSLLFGFPAWSGAIPKHEWSVGYHVGDVDRVPEVWAAFMNQEDVILTPSQWCRLAFIRSGVRRPIEIVQHGVSEAFRPRSDSRSARVVHFCSARDPSRKGTLELLEAMKGLDDAMLQHGFKLYTYSNSSTVGGIPERFGPPVQMAERLATAAMVVQPSRAEGFGMIPLEALACGTPIVATSCTGHAEYLSAETPGAVVIPTDKLEECGGARAPSLSVEAVTTALTEALDNYGKLARAACANAYKIRAEWSWDAVLRRSSLMKALQYA